MSRKTVLVLGAGGHAKVVIATLQAAGFDVKAAFDDDRRKWGTEVLGVPVKGGLAEAARVKSLAAVIAVGDNSARKAIAARFPEALWITAVHPKAAVHASARLGLGTVVFAGAVVQPEASIGAHGIVNTGATVDHDCALGDYVHVAPGAHLAGGVQLGDGVLMGVGSATVPYVKIGEWSVVGAGAAVVASLPAGIVAGGVPAKAIRKASRSGD